MVEEHSTMVVEPAELSREKVGGVHPVHHERQDRFVEFAGRAIVWRQRGVRVVHASGRVMRSGYRP